MDSYKDIKLAFKKQFPNLTITKVIDYDHKNVYVIMAVPSNRQKDAKSWLDGLYAMDKNSLGVLGAFNPIKNDPEVYFNLPSSSVIYENEIMSGAIDNG